MKRTLSSVKRRVGKNARSMRKQMTKMASAQRMQRRHARHSTGSLSTSSTVLGMPMWAAVSIGIVSLGGLIYGLMQLDGFTRMMTPVIHDVGEFFGLTEEHGIDTRNITHDRVYNSTIRS